MSRIGIIVYPGELPETCAGCKFYIYHPDGSRVCFLGCKRCSTEKLPVKCPINVWVTRPPENYVDWRTRVAERLRALRESKGLTQGEAARQSGYDQTQISSMECARYLSLNAMTDLCEFYGADPGDMFKDLDLKEGAGDD